MMESMTQSSSPATFSGWFAAETLESSRPNKGSITLDTDRLLLETDSVSMAVSLSDVRQVQVDNTHYEHGPFPPGRTPITVLHANENNNTVITIAAERPVIRSLTFELLENALAGIPVRVRHPIKLDGRTTPKSFERASLVPTDSGLQFDLGNSEVSTVSDIVSFNRVTAEETSGHILRIAASRGGIRYQTDIQLPNARISTLLNRYLHIQTKLAASQSPASSD
jgi:hypothetical protein